MPLLMPCSLLRSRRFTAFLSWTVSIGLLPSAYAAVEDRPASFAEGDASLSSFSMPHIPEPMLFDLVRPLGAKKGELEVNALVQHGEHGELEWAPEIEYAFADGYAIELELPYHNSHLGEYKLALQGTLGTLNNDTMVHGWQVIGRRERESGAYSADALYLAGLALDNSWSFFTMTGLRRSEFNSHRQTLGLFNTSVFYDWSQRLTLGVEINNEIGPGFDWRTRLVPQLHYDLGENTTLQTGIGPSWLAREGTEEWLFSWRLIHAW